ncbi:MAG TPA: YicC family protein [Chromatiaceae bacterium]|nr:YicC family protein [Chromatiaceae bacterium]HIA08988.1 YicC family protein [Chromatiaceae bacterium]HIN82897.1 YicC family protein [Chromatiales bacterium]HIO14824.1 YicC family protein [Chromatiales bacterium]HIO53629.1 YicC family protein [Chromatiales bacterium]
MTAFSRQELQAEWGSITWELRSVNHRYLEVGLRVPDDFRVLEPKFRDLMTNALGRGKVDAGLRFKPAAGAASGLRVNQSLVEGVLKAVAEVEVQMHVSQSLSPMDILRWPDVVTAEAPDMSVAHADAMELLQQTLDDFIAAREREGGRMGAVISSRCEALANEVERVAERRVEVLAHLRERLNKRLADLDVSADPGRLEQEMVMLAQRLDVDEELERLRSHLVETRSVLVSGEPIGRRLDFLMQEFNREANTLSSKSSDSETTKSAVEMKVLIEQMREQVQNLE